MSTATCTNQQILMNCEKGRMNCRPKAIGASDRVTLSHPAQLHNQIVGKTCKP